MFLGTLKRNFREKLRLSLFNLASFFTRREKSHFLLFFYDFMASGGPTMPIKSSYGVELQTAVY